MLSVLSAAAAVLVLAVAVQAQNGTMMVDANVTGTDGPVMMMTTTTSMMVEDNTTSSNDTGDVNISTTTTPDQPETTTTPMPTTTTYTTTTQDVPCNNSVGRLDEIYAFTTTPQFTDLLSQNEQILVYEVLAAAEGCKMTSFMNAETAERIFRMLSSLPVRHVYIFLHYMAEALENEGVVVPQ